MSAELIGLLYQHRWQVELFFRRLKCLAGFKHFYSESPEGLTLPVYSPEEYRRIPDSIGTEPGRYTSR